MKAALRYNDEVIAFSVRCKLLPVLHGVGHGLLEPNISNSISQV